jgi:hypothetical protein
MHGLGVSPLEDETFNTGVNVVKLNIPGTSSTSAVLSIMHQFTSDPNWRNTLQAEDIDVLTTLFPENAGYVHDFSTVTAN